MVESPRRRSRWLMRALEWDDPRARYPNVWHQGMPRQVLAFETVASRLRLGDLIAVWSPASERHPERSERYVGIARVDGLRRSHDADFAWVDLTVAHRFEVPLDLGTAPRRVFLCCDAGWPDRDVSLFQRVFDAAVAEGWRPAEDDAGMPHAAEPPGTDPPPPLPPVDASGHDDDSSPAEPPRPETEPDSAVQPEPEPHPRSLSTSSFVFGGVDFSGDMRDPRDKTWLVLVELRGERLRVIRLEPMGRHGLQARLRDPDAQLSRADAVGLDFPFGLPIPFAESLLGGPFPTEGWWALARKLERLSRPEYLTRLQEFRETHGEPKRHADDVASAFSPLHRVNPDLGPMTYHGIRMMAEERSRYAIRPFETARGRRLLEVYPGGSLRKLGLVDGAPVGGRLGAIVDGLDGLDRFPIDLEPAHKRTLLGSRDALDALIAARCAVVAAVSGEADRDPTALAPGHEHELHVEGWIYGLGG